jgi:hypothetical protein
VRGTVVMWFRDDTPLSAAPAMCNKEKSTMLVDKMI